MPQRKRLRKYDESDNEDGVYIKLEQEEEISDENSG